MYSARAIAAIGLFAWLGGDVQAAEPVIPLAAMTVDGETLVSDDEDQPLAFDISGMACLPPQGDARKCLVINDENRQAQFAVVRGDRMTGGQPVPLIGDEPDPDTLGAPPKEKCGDKGKFKNLDGEGVAYARPFFYIVGSHGCSRSKDKFQLSSFILARVRVDAQGRAADSSGRPVADGAISRAVETTYRVSDLLKQAKHVKRFYAKNLKNEEGLNIEGVAVQGDQIWFGLRAPVTDAKKDGKKREEQSFLVGGSVADLFAPGHKKAKAEPDVVSFDLSGLGIRDLAALPDGRLLILAGPASEEEVAFQLFVADPVAQTAKSIGTFPVVKGPGKKGDIVPGKPEGVTLLDPAADAASAVILFDSLKDGAPHLARFAIPRPD